MNIDSQSVTLFIPDYISWVKDLGQIVIINEQSKDAFMLRDVEAIVWGWLSYSTTHKNLVSMLAVLLRVTYKEAEIQLSAMLNDWVNAGVLGVLEEGAFG